MQNMQRPSRISAYRRGLNSHEAAKRPEDLPLPQQTTRQQLVCGQVGAGLASIKNDKDPQYDIEPPRCVRGSRVHSVRGAAAPRAVAVGLAHAVRRLEYVACHGSQRGAGGTCSGPGGVTGP